jgi:molybdopterin molybdotransferase
LTRPVDEYTSVDDVLSAVLQKITLAARVETLPIRESYGRVSAENVLAPADVPPLATSHMDGFAVISNDARTATESAPVKLAIVGEAGPGERPTKPLGTGKAIRIATGSVLPKGADTVVPIEFAEVTGRNVRVKRPVEPGSNVFAAGEDVRKGTVVLSKGRDIRAQDIGMMIALGFEKVSVRKKPKVSVIATGNELTVATRPKKGQIRESHSPVFLRLCASWGCAPIDGGIVGDDPVVLTDSIKKALATSDLVVTLGGTSAGKRDFVIESVQGLEPGVLFHGIKLDRGRVTGIAEVEGTPVLMLPGPIQAAMNAFLVLGSPIIGKLTGKQKIGTELACKMGEDWDARKRFADFRKVVYVRLRHGREIIAEPILAETESMKLLADADGYVVVPEDVRHLSKGSSVNVNLIPGFSYA